MFIPAVHYSRTPTVEYVTTTPGNNGGTVTVPSPTEADRYIIYVTARSATGVSLTSCTMNGIAAEVASSGVSSFACAKVPTGTSIVISTTYAAGGGTGSSYCGFVYVAYGLESPIWRAVNYNIGNPASATVTVPEGGLVFAPAWIDNDGQSPAFTENSGQGIVRDIETDNGNSFGLASAHVNALTTTGGDDNLNVTCQITTANGSGCYMGLGVLR